MTGLSEVLASAYEITKRNMAVLTEHGSYIYPEDELFDLSFGEAAGAAGCCKGYNIYRLDISGGACYACIQTGCGSGNEADELVLLGIKAALKGYVPEREAVLRLLDGSCGEAELMGLPESLKQQLCGYVALVECSRELHSEAVEIMVNTAAVGMHFEYGGRIFAVVKEEDIEEACGMYYKNVVSELFSECCIAIGGKCEDIRSLGELYENCLEAFLLKDLFKLKDNVLIYDRLYSYRIAHDLNGKLKDSIAEKLFTPEFKELMAGEMGHTVEEFFNNNLTLTDTASKLYLHRNTLLYRLDKIHKTTGFDLKKFEDSWFFRLAWLIYKERG